MALCPPWSFSPSSCLPDPRWKPQPHILLQSVTRTSHKPNAFALYPVVLEMNAHLRKRTDHVLESLPDSQLSWLAASPMWANLAEELLSERCRLGKDEDGTIELGNLHHQLGSSETEEFVSGRNDQGNFNNRIIDFGKHKGERLGSLPNSYLRWMIGTQHGGPEWAKLAKLVLSERGQLESSVALQGEEDGDDARWTHSTCEYLSKKLDISNYASQLRCCSHTKALSEGMGLHDSIIRCGCDTDRFLGNLLVQMYGSCGSLDDARAVFCRILDRNLYSWTILIEAFTENGHDEEALKLHKQMQVEGVQPDKVTFICILNACASLSSLIEGRKIHALIALNGFESDVVVGTALVNLYGKCGIVEDARIAFCKMHERNEVTWNAMIATCAQNGNCEEALKCFHQMQTEGFKPDRITFIAILDACGSLAALAEGRDIHDNILEMEFQSDVAVGTALISMYSKCGSLEGVRCAFAGIPVKDHVSWNAVISACGQNGDSKEALRLFSQMQAEGFKPDKVTFSSILTACSHTGLVDYSRCIFATMMGEHGVTPAVEHYMSMIDILGRAGQLDEAEDLIKKSPFEDVGSVWFSLLCACRNHCDVLRAVRAADRVFQLDPRNASAFISLANIFATAGRWDDAGKIRNAMKDAGLKKTLGCSHIEVDKQVHKFVARDVSHPFTEAIYAELQRLQVLMKEAGYVPYKEALLQDVGEQAEEHMLCYHSEILAIAFGLISTTKGRTIRITNNLRTCSSCHTAIKFISSNVHRKIIVRDFNRFHHFQHGLCSCGDYW